MSRHTDHLSLRVTPRRTEIILKVLQDKHSAEWCNHYGEPGYHDPETGVILCNWNPLPGWVGEYLEAAGYETQWSDEWIIDYENDKAYRCSPDGYDWTPSFRYTPDGEMLTPDDDMQEFIDLCKGDPNQVLPPWIQESDLLDRDWRQHPADGPDFESGLHPGQNDNPAEILKTVPEDCEFVFRLSEQSQFYCRFQCWIKERES